MTVHGNDYLLPSVFQVVINTYVFLLSIKHTGYLRLDFSSPLECQTKAFVSSISGLERYSNVNKNVAREGTAPHFRGLYDLELWPSAELGRHNSESSPGESPRKKRWPERWPERTRSKRVLRDAIIPPGPSGSKNDALLNWTSLPTKARAKSPWS